MTNLRAILNRLVQENLHGPIDTSSYQETTRNHTTRQAQGSVRGPHADSYRDFQELQRHDIDLDTHDPRSLDLSANTDPSSSIASRWRQLFYELFISDESDDRNDDLLFFVRRVSYEDGAGVDPVFVKRKIQGVRYGILTPEQENVVLWKDTFFLNLIVQLQCKLTVAVCSRVTETNPVTGATKSSMICTRKHVTKRVYALPTKSRMDVKEESVECSWPLIYYVIDDFEDSFEQLMVHDNEYLCVELTVTVPNAKAETSPTTSSFIPSSRPQSSLISTPLTVSTGVHLDRTKRTTHDSNWNPPISPTGDALQPGRPFPSTSNRNGNKIILFQGAVGYQSLLKIYQQKAAPKVGRRFKFGPHTVPTEFIMMRGPGARGHAQVAITASNIGDDLTTLDDGTLVSPTSTQNYAEKALPPIPNNQQNTHHPNDNGQKTAFEKGYVNVNYSLDQSGQISPSSPVGEAPSSPRSFSAGSFFQSLRRISMATLAQATSHSPQQLQQHKQQLQHRSSYTGHTDGVGYGGGNESPTSSAVQSLTQNLNQSTPSVQSSSSPPLSSHRQHEGTNGSLYHNQQQQQQQQQQQLPANSISNRTSSSYSSSSRQEIDRGGVGTRQEIEALVKSPASLRCCMTFVNVPWMGIITMLMDHAYHPSFSNPPTMSMTSAPTHVDSSQDPRKAK
ncbi:hypothetical protein FBU30_006260 [Linnemannia zychae]|nr:hypothetical protein FBU30_006260 [Linnemannia zychae]